MAGARLDTIEGPSVLHPAKDGLEIELIGEIAAIIDLGARSVRISSASIRVAGSVSASCRLATSDDRGRPSWDVDQARQSFHQETVRW
jgi:hypothetical protein